MSFRKSSHFQDPMEATGSFTGTFDGDVPSATSASDVAYDDVRDKPTLVSSSNQFDSGDDFSVGNVDIAGDLEITTGGARIGHTSFIQGPDHAAEGQSSSFQEFQVLGGNDRPDSSMLLAASSNTGSNGPFLYFGRSAGNGLGSFSRPLDGYDLGGMLWGINDGFTSDFRVHAASIKAEATGFSASAGYAGAQLVFSVAGYSAVNDIAEAMRIRSDTTLDVFGNEIVSGNLIVLGTSTFSNIIATGSFTGTLTGDFVGNVASASHALRADDADNADGGTGSFTGDFNGSFTGSAELTASITGALTGSVQVLNSPFATVPGAAAGTFDAENFTLGELGARFGAVVNELLVFVAPPPPGSLPQPASITLFYDVREQGDATIINDTSTNNKDMHRPASASFTFRTGPPSVDLLAGVDAINPSVDTSIMRGDADGTSTLMILIKPADNSLSYVTDYSNGHNILLSFVTDMFELFIGGSEHTGDDPRVNTQLPATSSVWQTVCYTIGADGAGKQGSYHNGLRSGSLLNKSFDLTQATTDFEIGHVAGGTDFTGSFGGYVHWDVQLTDEEVKTAHNFFRSISVDYGLPEAL